MRGRDSRMDPLDDRYEPLLARRVPADEIVIGHAYVIHARNGGVGVAVNEDGHLGYRLHREKFGNLSVRRVRLGPRPAIRHGDSARSYPRRATYR